MGELIKSRASTTKKRTRIQQEKGVQILDAALEIFSTHGYRGSTLDQIADAAGLSKPNLLYYFRTKEAIHNKLIEDLLHMWLAPLEAIDPQGDAVDEILAYVDRKLDLAQKFPRESRLFANEILQGAPRIKNEFRDLKTLVDKKAKLIRRWSAEGKLADRDPYHLIFAIWSTTQHYADFDVQVRAVLGDKDSSKRFEEAAEFLKSLFLGGLKPQQ